MWYNITVKNSKKGVILVTLAEKLIQEFEKLPEERKMEVIDFVEFMKQKEQREIEKLMDLVIEENKEALEELAK